MTFTPRQLFERAIVKEQLGHTTNYLGETLQLFKQGVVKRMEPIAHIMGTEKTWRKCRGCKGEKLVAHAEVTGQLSLMRCLRCKGEGVVFG